MNHAFLGLAMIAVMLLFLFKKWFSPLVTLVIVPPIFGLLAGYSLEELSSFIADGITTPMSAALVAMFAMIYFSIMTDAGLFDPIVNWIASKCGSHIPLATLGAAAIAHLAHLDGQSTSTLMLTIPTMLPIFDRLKIDRKYLYIIIGMAIGVMNVVPWGGGITTSAAGSGLDPTYIFRTLLPVLACGLVYNFIVAYLLGLHAQKHPFVGELKSGMFALEFDENRVTKIDRKYWLNLILTIVVFFLIFEATFNGQTVFMFGLALALVINYKDLKACDDAIDRYAKNAFRVSLVMWASGVFIGVMTNSDMMSSLADAVFHILPDSISNLLGVIAALFAAVFGLALSNEALNLGVMPLFMRSAELVGYPPETMAFVFPLMIDAVFFLCLTGPRPWMVSGMLGVDTIDCWKKAFLPIMGLAVVEIIAAGILGVIPI